MIGDRVDFFPGPTPAGRQGEIVPTPPLPIEGAVELDMPVADLWQAFLDVQRWSAWNQSIWRSTVRGDELRVGAWLVWAFNSIDRRYPYKLPAIAEIVELEPEDRVTWEVKLPGFHALHAYRFADLGSGRCRFGSWEVAAGPLYRLTRRFWLAHFRFVCRESLIGAERLARRE